MTISNRDYNTPHGSALLAARIERYWRERGYEKVLVAPVTVEEWHDHSVYGVRSNVGEGGYPPR